MHVYCIEMFICDIYTVDIYSAGPYVPKHYSHALYCMRVLIL